MAKARTSRLWGTAFVFFVMLVLSSIGGSAAVGRIIYVDDDGPADYNNIQAAIDDANDGDTVEIQLGTYTGPGNRDIDFKGKPITVQSTDPNDPDIVDATMIDANGTEAAPHRCFIFQNAEDQASVLAGLSITGGYSKSSKWPADSGGGIHCFGSSPTITKCVVRGNYAFEKGGGILCVGGSPYISSCSIRNNSADYSGGGISTYGSDLTVKRCTIRENHSGFGGGVAGEDADINISDSYFSDNIAGYGGGLWSRSGLTLSYSVFRANQSYIDDPVLAGGGGVSIHNRSAKVDHCIFTANSTQGLGGGLCFSKTCSDSGPQVELTNCTFAYNGARSGGAAAVRGSGSTRLDLRNCIIWANEPNDSSSLYLESFGMCGFPKIYVDSSILQGPENEQFIFTTNCSISDPCFADPNNSDYHVKSQAGRYDPNSTTWLIDDVTSPGIDAGNPMDPIGPEPFPNGGIVNMGAYGGTAEASKSYFGKPPCEIIVAGDVNGDCEVNFLDFHLMALHWCEDHNL